MDNKEIYQKLKNISSKQFDRNDALGSYTGVCENPNDEPVQDADDL